ncbi:MAG: 3-hydroxybutyryl-CoA dehydrogenase [Candidatus Aminicenantes bacterium RBG_16_63_16]|nr:MAG: 3-hydroxybutyryl-CoA dehydrogenase [Candidatus Aminicenantes bacterium RBG_16_63_16]
MRKPFVVGAGAMGAGIGQLCAQQGFSVTITDVTQDIIGNARQKIIRGLDQRIEKGKITSEEKDVVLSRMSWAADLGAARESDFVIEAVSENLELKKKLFRELDGICPPETVLTTNTTALSISEIASATRRPEKVVGMHFFNPAAVMKLVEIIRGSQSSENTIAAARQFAEKLGKIPIVTAKEAPAGIVSRVLAGMLNEAAAVYEAGIASAQDIDEAMKLGAGLPMGPLALMDMIGLDIHLAKMDTLYQKLRDDRYKTPEIVREMVARGKLGRKTGEGFHKY